jgi:ubiquinone/menaquinone biosynthesis C-methylase UbiE
LVTTPPTGRQARHSNAQTDRIGRRAPGYERDGLGPLLISLQCQTLARLRLTTADRFLDVGCATGAAVRAAAKHVHLAIGIDLSVKMIKHTRSHPRAQYTLAQAEHLPFPAHIFTAVLCARFLHFLDDPDRAVAEMTRVLRPDGRLVIGDFHHDTLPAIDPPRAWPGLTVTHRWHTLTPFGFYEILLARPAT